MLSHTETRRFEDLNSAPRCVLFVEDNAEDYILACWQLAKAQLRNRVLRVSSADELLGYFRAMDQYLDQNRYPMPAVIVMDMHLPGAGGLEAQAMLRTNLRFRQTPIIVISSPENLALLKEAVELGADAWMIKPFDAREFVAIVQALNLPLFFDAPRDRNVEGAVIPQKPPDTLDFC